MFPKISIRIHKPANMFPITPPPTHALPIFPDHPPWTSYRQTTKNSPRSEGFEPRLFTIPDHETVPRRQLFHSLNRESYALPRKQSDAAEWKTIRHFYLCVPPLKNSDGPPRKVISDRDPPAYSLQTSPESVQSGLGIKQNISTATTHRQELPSRRMKTNPWSNTYDILLRDTQKRLGSDGYPLPSNNPGTFLAKDAVNERRPLKKKPPLRINFFYKKKKKIKRPTPLWHTNPHATYHGNYP